MDNFGNPGSDSDEATHAGSIGKYLVMDFAIVQIDDELVGQKDLPNVNVRI